MTTLPGRVASLLPVVLILCLCGSASGHGVDPRLKELRDAKIRREGPLVEAIQFAGNETFEREDLLRYMGLRESGFFRPSHFDRGVLDKDLENLERLYMTRGFFDAEASIEDVELSADSLAIEILIGIYEGPRWFVREITLDGNHAISEDRLRAGMRLEPGGPFLSNALDRDRRSVLDAYAKRSYLDARVFQTVERDDVSREASIRYRIVEREPAVIGAIDVTGDEKTRQYVVEREFEFAVGESFDFEKIGETQARVYRTGLFHSVWIEPAVEDTGKARKRLEVRVSERPSGRFDFKFGYAALDGLEVGAGVADRNVQGQAIELGVEGRYSELEREARVSAGDPWFTGRRIAIDASARYVWNDERSYVAETVGAGFILTKRFGTTVTLEGGYEFDRTVVLETAEEAGDVGENYTSDLLSAVTYDTRDDILNARRGMLARAEVDFASSRLGGTNDFAKYELVWRGYKRIRHGRVGALSARFGWIKPQGETGGVPVNERYFAGGEGSVRGFQRNSLGPRSADDEPIGGRALLEIRGEVRFPVVQKLRMAAFVDAGNVFHDFVAANLSGLAVGGGLGLRYDTRVGVLRFDVATPLSEKGPPQYYFGVGQAF